MTADFLGNLFMLLCNTMPGRNKKERCKQLWLRIQRFYVDNEVKDKLSSLTVKMICQPKKILSSGALLLL